MMHIITWILFGLFITLGFVIYDVITFINLLRFTNGSNDKHGRDIINVVDEEKELIIYNQLWDLLREIYQETRNEIGNESNVFNDKSEKKSKPSLL